MKDRSVLEKYNDVAGDTENRFLKSVAGFILAVNPVLAPYRILGISVVWLMCAAFLLAAIFCTKKPTVVLKRELVPVYFFAIMAFVFSLNGLLELNNRRNLINSLVGVGLDLVFFMLLWYFSDIESTMKHANRIGLICCGYAFFQMLMLFTSNPVPLGKLPFFEMSASQGWIPEIWGFRFNSLFSEPSYFAIYLLPLFIFNLLRNRWGWCCLFAAFIIFSSSSLGIIAMAATLVWYLFWDELVKRGNTKRILAFVCIGAFALLICVFVPQINGLIRATLLKMSGLFSESNDARLLGHIEYFAYYPFKEQLFGTGLAQLQNYFAEHGIEITNYSNGFILTIMNLGILGGVGLVYFLISAWLTSINRHSVLFFLAFVLIFATDGILLGYRFYYLIYFIWNYCDKEKENNEDTVCNIMRAGNKYFGNKK